MMVHEANDCSTINRWRWCWRHDYPLVILSILVVGVCSLEIAAHEKTFAQVRSTLLTLGLAVPAGVWLLKQAPARVRKWVIGGLLVLWVSATVLIFITVEQPDLVVGLLRWLHARWK